MEKITPDRLFSHPNMTESATAFTLSGVTFNEVVSIPNTVLSKSLLIENVIFNDGIEGYNTLFEKDLRFVNCFIKRMRMDDIQVNGFFQLENLELNSAASFSKGIFRGGFQINDCRFGMMVNLDEIQVEVENINLNYTFIKNSTFNDLLDLTHSKFNSLLFFENVIFNYDVDFTAIQLVNESYEKSRYGALNFRNLHVGEFGVVKFMGTENDKLFNSDVVFSNEKIIGKLEFEHVNYHKINIDARARFEPLIREEKIIVGRGCLKYRHETPIKRIVINAESQNLVTELSNTFVEFFKNKNGLNLGVEVRERTEEYIGIVYFTDENISYMQFESMLQKSENEMWQLVKINNQNILTENAGTSFPDKLIAGSDTIINLVGIILKILTRIPLGKINPKELNSLMTTASFTPNLSFETSIFKTINVNQIILLGIGNNQSAKLT